MKYTQNTNILFFTKQIQNRDLILKFGQTTPNCVVRLFASLKI